MGETLASDHLILQTFKRLFEHAPPQGGARSRPHRGGDPVEIELVPEGILLKPRKLIDSTQAWFWAPSWQAGEAEASADIEAGRVTVHESDDAFLDALGDVDTTAS
ncbi:MAG: AbrB family transcriptional regulator [Actinomycetota bacterium]